MSCKSNRKSDIKLERKRERKKRNALKWYKCYSTTRKELYACFSISYEHEQVNWFHEYLFLLFHRIETYKTNAHPLSKQTIPSNSMAIAVKSLIFQFEYSLYFTLYTFGTSVTIFGRKIVVVFANVCTEGSGTQHEYHLQKDVSKCGACQTREREREKLRPMKYQFHQLRQKQ